MRGSERTSGLVVDEAGGGKGGNKHGWDGRWSGTVACGGRSHAHTHTLRCVLARPVPVGLKAEAEPKARTSTVVENCIVVLCCVGLVAVLF